MSYTINDESPCKGCTKSASGLNEIEELFGFRIMTNGNKIPQSYCKDCRTKKCSPNNIKCNKN